MDTPTLPSDIQEKILNAQTVNGIPPQKPIVAYKNLGDLLAQQAERQEEKAFLIFYSSAGTRQELSYIEFSEQVYRTANALRHYGIQPGDRIATVSYNHPDVVIQYFAAFLLGAVVVPINVEEDDNRIAYIFENAGIRLAFVRDQFVARILPLKEKTPALAHILQVGNRIDPALPHLPSEILRQSDQFTHVDPPTHGDEALIVYTSGTTGSPKGVVLTHYNLLVDAMAITEWHQLSSDQRMMCVLPIHHVNGTVVTLIAPLYCGGTVVLNQKFSSEKFFERARIEKVNVVSVVPTLLQFLLSAKPIDEAYKLAQIRHFICGAGPLTVELAAKFEKHFTIPIIHGYGLSETTCYSCFLPLDLTAAQHKSWMTDFGYPSIGVPLPVNEMSIHNENGSEVEEGEKGEIVIRGHNVMKYYFRNEEANRSTFVHGWFRSGDEGFFKYDDQGRKFFFITGRLKELIIRGGVNISPLEIDEVLTKMPGVQIGIAVGFDNDWYGEEVGALIRLRDDIQIPETEILNHCRKYLPFAKSPKVAIVTDDVPVTSTGKYQRNECKHLFERWKSVQFTEQR